ncbi:hypothetical protein [Mesorhizobium sp. B2-8-9]|uniref:hypothetical protein n=1 Tax=Mesorhizobium sp. B2-8-9 TaxID=2589899 RepID=UPI00112DE55D|nr:hypothetical protein [Mesorhizobium sp. B2-8-9]TPI78000.1 hypothetical protein FJ423_16745 [Mesorhizobium sp. B2-8-9]
MLAGGDPQDLFAKNGLLDDLKKALSERIPDGEPAKGGCQPSIARGLQMTRRGGGNAGGGRFAEAPTG